MLDQALRSLQDALAIKGIRRVLWFLLVLTVFVVCFETRTNYFEINAISKRLDVLEKAGHEPVSAEQAKRIEGLKNGVLEELEIVQAKRANPFNEFWKMLVRFVKGAWIMLPLHLLVIKVTLFFLRDNKKVDRLVKAMMAYFGWLCLSVGVWITSVVGLNSVRWIYSQSPCHY